MDVRTKQKIIEMLKAGKPVDAIAKRFPGVPVLSIRATKAHVTRGTHGK